MLHIETQTLHEQFHQPHVLSVDEDTLKTRYVPDLARGTGRRSNGVATISIILVDRKPHAKTDVCCRNHGILSTTVCNPNHG